MLMEGFSVLLKWLEKPSYFTCRNKTNPNYSYSRLSFSQPYKFTSAHPHSHNEHMSQSESHGTTPMAVTGSVFHLVPSIPHLVPIFLASHWILDLIFGQQVPPSYSISKRLSLWKYPISCKCMLLKSYLNQYQYQYHLCQRACKLHLDATRTWNRVKT